MKQNYKLILKKDKKTNIKAFFFPEMTNIRM